MPIRKAGLWEMKIVKTGSALPEMTMQHCTDETTDKQMSTAFSPVAKEACSKNDIAKTATGYVVGFGVQRRRRDDDLACRNHRRFQFRLHRQVHRAQRQGPGRRLHDVTRRSRRSGSAPASPIRSPAIS